MQVAFTEDRRAEVDACIVLPAIKAVRRFAGIGIKDAIGVHIVRYRKLRAKRPAEFSCYHEEYF